MQQVREEAYSIANNAQYVCEQVRERISAVRDYRALSHVAECLIEVYNSDFSTEMTFTVMIKGCLFKY
ncbi:hypothetical protein WIW90_05040 [Sulfolobaceae archaeon RB850M]